ncbi:MAG: mechanosensitive ion channel [Bacteroidota bacterium]|nr:mechanosensitive ion channel [Bacteroidota bacterium]
MIFENKTFLINLPTVGYTALIVVFALLFGYFTIWFMKKFKEKEGIKLLQTSLLSIIALSAMLGISVILIKNFNNIELFETKFFFIKAIDIYIVSLVLLITFLSVKVLNKLLFKNSETISRQKNVKRRSKTLIKAILWILVIALIFKIILKGSVHPGEYILVTISKIDITVFDLFLLSVIFAATNLVLMALRRFFAHQVDNGHMEMGNSAALFKIVKYLIIVVAIVFGLNSAGFNLSILLAGSAALLVGFGIGIQNVFLDIVSGFILLLERPLKASDIIEVDGIVGKVKSIGIRTTTLYTRDDTIIRVPNSKFTSDIIANWSDIKKNTRFKVDVGVAYGSDVELVMKSLQKCAENHKKVDSYPAPFARFENFGDSSLDFSLFFWSSENMRIERIKSDIRVAVDKTFREHQITIPFPQRDVHHYKH